MKKVGLNKNKFELSRNRWRKNIVSITYCTIRIRLSIRAKERINEERLQKISRVLGIINDEQVQVIIGPGKVNKVAKNGKSVRYCFRRNIFSKKRKDSNSFRDG